MKIHLFLYLFLLSGGSLIAQELYTPEKVTKGENASYYCTSITKSYIAVRNVQNADTTSIVYDKNGKIVKNEHIVGEDLFTLNELVAVLKETLTTEEWNSIKERKRFFMGMIIVSDDTGKTQEITFQFRKEDPIFSKLSPDRLYIIEQKFKQIIKLQLTETAKTYKNPKFPCGIHFEDLF